MFLLSKNITTTNIQHITTFFILFFNIIGAESDDGGLYTCSAINTVGKCTWETTVDLKAKPAFTLPSSLTKPITFQIDELMSLKVPLIAVPEPSLLLEKIDPQDEDKVEATFQALVRLFKSLLDNAPNDLVGCIIQKRTNILLKKELC